MSNGAALRALLPYQQRWLADKADVKLWEKSRRIGASWSDAADSVLTAARKNGQDVLYIGYSEDMTREYIDDCAMWAKAFSRAAAAVNEVMFEDAADDGTRTSIKAFRIDFASGFKILALSSRPRSIRGKQGKVKIDEAAFHDDLPGLMKAALALLIWGGQVCLMSSHNGAENYFNQLVLDIRAGRLPYSLHRTTFEDALQDGLYQRVCLKAGREWTQSGQDDWRASIFARYRDNADEELMCVPSAGTGIWLPRSLIQARMAPGAVIRYRAPKGMALWPEHVQRAEIDGFCKGWLEPELAKLDGDQRTVMGTDFGRYVDLSVNVPMQIGPTLKKRVPFTVELSDTPFTAQKQIWLYLAERLPRFSAAKLDRTGNGAYLAEEAQRMFGEECVEGVQLSEGWYRDHTAPFKADLEDDMLQLVRDDDTATDLAAFRMVRGVPRIPDLRTTAADGGKRHGDSGIAHLLAHAAALSDYTPMEYFSSGRPRASRAVDDYRGFM